MSDIIDICKQARAAAYVLQGATTAYKNEYLRVVATAIRENVAAILSANVADVEAAKANGKPSAFVDRLTLTESRVLDMAKGVDQVIELDDPVGAITSEWSTDTGLRIRKVRMPLGVVAIIYEARPNVTVDALALCIKSGNAVILRGSKDALGSNLCIYRIIKNALEKGGFESNAIGMVDSPSYDATAELLQQEDYVDVVIPRGGNALKDYVQRNAKMPVIASAGGNCHVYVEGSADFDMATRIVVNSKVQRPGTCNAAEQLLIDESISREFLPIVVKALQEQGVELCGCPKCLAICPNLAAATDEDYYTEHLCLKMSVYIVSDYKEAIARINAHNTRHSDAIVSENDEAVRAFMNDVDAACVYHNASTRFTDGFQFGYGAEMGISTGKLHVRGPMGLEALTSEKLEIFGNGQIRR